MFGGVKMLKYVSVPFRIAIFLVVGSKKKKERRKRGEEISLKRSLKISNSCAIKSRNRRERRKEREKAESIYCWSTWRRFVGKKAELFDSSREGRGERIPFRSLVSFSCRT